MVRRAEDSITGIKCRQEGEIFMRTSNVICPVCGKVNYNLYLEETGGYMECDRCGSILKNPGAIKTMRYPALGIKMLDDSKYLKSPALAGGPI